MNSPLSEQIGSVNTLSKIAHYQADPLAVYQYLCAKQNNSLLLESAEIDKKHKLKSLMITDAAVKIVCHGQQVTFTALSLNGQSALDFAQETLEKSAEINREENKLIVTFPEADTELDENSRLKQINAFQALRLFEGLKNIDNHPFASFLGGVFAFDMMATCEVLPTVADSDNTCPDYVFYLAETMIVINHEQETCEVIGNIFSGANQEKSKQQIEQRINTIKQALASDVTFQRDQEAIAAVSDEVSVDISDENFCEIVDDLKEHIRAGDIFQVVPSRTFSLACPAPLASYQALRISNPSPYMFYLHDEDFIMFGASPESALKYQQSNRQVEIYPIAGTRKRGFDDNGNFSLDLDSRIELELRQDKKELAEHIMLVDLARNDIARVSQPGSRYVADLLKVDRYSHVMHLVSRVCGTLSEDLDALHAYQACMNMGTLSGAPKVKATELIRKFEGKRRGSYGGAVGYITGEGEMDTCIVIRSAFVNNGIAQVQAGAGVVYDSVPQAESDETRQKAQAVLSAIKHVSQQAKQSLEQAKA